ncbi:protein quiver [Caerostris darwini]|uniref:Protein quiver n=1 Tax=Caerostris darwini TaxID=1538125 RepID=A0AAV4UWA6_9ARAC|nr:protein quiver [Caerostris darwini]
MNNISLAGLTICILHLIVPAFCLECYRCNSTGNLDCLEKFMYPNPLRPESCSDVFEAQYCIKTTGIYDGVVGTRRFCSSRDLGNFCEFIFHKGEQREYKGCVYTCATDGCNTASTNFKTHLSVGLITLTALVSIVYRRLLNSS